MMSTYERSRKVEVEGLPPGYEVSFHEIRGYDSPDKWYEATYRGKKIGKSAGMGYGSARDAARAAHEHAAEQVKLAEGVQGATDTGDTC